jgi:hypothetical protein
MKAVRTHLVLITLTTLITLMTLMTLRTDLVQTLGFSVGFFYDPLSYDVFGVTFVSSNGHNGGVTYGSYRIL